MPKYVYIHFNADVPKTVEREYNRMCRYEQYLAERDLEHNLISYDNLKFGLQIADKTTTEEYMREMQSELLWQRRLELLPAALDWLRFESQEEYNLILEYYFASDEKVTLHTLAEKYSSSFMAIFRRLEKARMKLKKFILMHEKENS